MGKYVHAFGIGWIIYMVGMVLSAYEGILSLIFQPFLAAVTSLIFTFLAILVGQIFRIQKIKIGWKDIKAIRYILWLLGLILLIYPIPFGHYAKMVDPSTGEIALNVSVSPLMLGYFLIIFTVAHWPTKQKFMDNLGKS